VGRGGHCFPPGGLRGLTVAQSPRRWSGHGGIFQAAQQVSAMPKFIIERQVPGASRFTHEELQGISRRSVGVLRQLGPEIQWVESYVAGDHLYCIYVAPDEEMVREHGRLGGFPVNKVTEVRTMIDPTTAE